MNIRIAGIHNDSIVDGTGIRLTVFVQGCPHHCEGCHNPETHDFHGGRVIDTSEIIRMMEDNPLLDGLTLSGGEPFCQPEPCIELARAAHRLGLNVWAYTGYTVHEICKDATKSMLLPELDVLIDGRFDITQKTLNLPWRGSKNQRLIEIKRGEKDGGL